MAIVKAAIAEINDQKSQADILKTLVNRASSFAPRVAFFAIKGPNAAGWRGRGFEGTVGDEAIQQIILPLAADTLIGGAAKSLDTWSGGPGSHSEDHLLMNRIGEEPPQRVVAIPLTVRKRAVAVLYADSAGLDSESINLEALETLVRVSGMAVELLSVSRVAPRKVAEEPAAEVHEEKPAQAYTPTSEYEEPAAPPPSYGISSVTADTLRPEAFQHETAQPSAAVEQPEAEPVSAIVEEEVPEVAPEHATPSSEVVAPSAEVAAPRRRYGTDAELPIEVSSDEERRLHNDARRFARLLISEIKLYNEQKVVEGRSQNDLYDRLREYIDRSREMYDKRVKAEVASRYDYFHGELVNTLAEGDAAKLGSNYPGATVNA